MAEPDLPPSLVTLVLKRGGVFGLIGVIGLFIAGVGSIGEGLGFFKMPPGVSQGLVLIGWSFVGLCILSGTWHATRATQMIATTAAKGEVDRAVIINAVTPAQIVVKPTSADPAVTREIKKLDTTIVTAVK